MAKTIRETVDFDAPAHAVFDALMDARKHASFTGAKARIEPRVGGSFSVWDGYATGTTVRLEKDKVIVQAWRTSDFAPEDPDSEVTFRFTRKGSGTRLLFVHWKVPEALADDIAQGWTDFYWTPLKAYLGTHRRT